MTRRSILLAGYTFIYLPIIVLVVYSFNASKLVTVWGGFSTHWYAELMHNTALLSAAGRSVLIGSVSASVSTLLGLLAAYVLTQTGRFFGRRFITASLNIPVILPDIVLGLMLLLLIVNLQQWNLWPASRGLVSIMLAHSVVGMAYATFVIAARWRRLDPMQVEAARDLGATDGQVFRSIQLPQLWPALIAAWLMAFTLSFDDLVIASFVSGPDSSTLPMLIYSSVRLGTSPQINALATILIAGVAVVVVCACFLLQHAQNRSSRRI